jgi:hypothetical protein
MKKQFNGKLSEWFINAKEEELIMLDMMSPGAIGRLCVLLSLEQQILLEKDGRNKTNIRRKN